MRCTNCRTVTAPGPDACPSCGGALELGFLDVVRWTAIGVLRGLTTGRASSFVAVIAAVLVAGLGFYGARAVFGPPPELGPADQPVSTIASMRPVPTERLAAPEPEPVLDEQADLEFFEPWRQVLGAAPQDVGQAVAHDPSGDLVFVGRSARIADDAFSDTLFIRTDPKGNVTSQAVLNSLNGAQSTAVDVDATGATYVAGIDGLSLNVVRVNEAGDMIWGTALSSPGVSAGVAMIAGRGVDGVIVAAAGEEPGTVQLLHLDEDGREVWRATMTTGAILGPIDLAPAPDGGVYLGGSFLSGDGTAIPEIIQVNSKGAAVWRSGIQTRTGDDLAGLASAPEGGVYAAGLASAEKGGLLWLARVDADGEIRWEADINAGRVVAPVTVATGGNMGVHMASAISVDAAAQDDLWVARIADDGNLLWDTILASPSSETVEDLYVTPGGDIVLTGSLSPVDVFDRDFMMLRLGRGGVPPPGLSDALGSVTNVALWRPDAVRSPAEADPVEVRSLPRADPAGARAAILPASIDPAATDPVQLLSSRRQASPEPVSDPDGFEAGLTAQSPVRADNSAIGPSLDPVTDGGAEAEPATVSLSCSFRCQTTDGVVKYPVSETYRDVPYADRNVYALGLGGEAERVCAASGGVVVPLSEPVCE